MKTLWCEVEHDDNVAGAGDTPQRWVESVVSGDHPIDLLAKQDHNYQYQPGDQATAIGSNR